MKQKCFVCNKMFSLRSDYCKILMMHLSRIKNSFLYAAKGIMQVAREEQNFRIQLFAAMGIVVLMFVFDLSIVEKSILVLVIVLVLVLELMNSIFERLADMLKPRLHHYVRDIKDMLAGMVLVASIGATLIGTMIFLPHFRLLL